METLYRILKIMIVVLLMAVIAVGVLTAVGQPREQAAPAETAAQDTAPDITVYDEDGNAVKLSDFRGQPVVLNFWASWCGPCKAEMPDLQSAWETYGEDIAFLLVNLTDGSSETVESATAYVASQGYSFPVYYDTDLSGATAYSVYAIPVTYFIDAEGVVRAVHEGMISADALTCNLDALMQG